MRIFLSLEGVFLLLLLSLLPKFANELLLSPFLLKDFCSVIVLLRGASERAGSAVIEGEAAAARAERMGIQALKSPRS